MTVQSLPYYDTHHHIYKMNKRRTAENCFLINGKTECSAALFPQTENMQELYEVFRVERGVALFLEEHLERFFGGARELGWQIPQPSPLLFSQLKQFVGLHLRKDGNIRLSCWFSPGAATATNYTARFVEHHYPAAMLYKTGVACELIAEEYSRPTVKIADRALRNRTDAVIKSQQLFETILVNQEGEITEGSRSNLFFIRDNNLYTAPDSVVLPGIMRKKVLTACAQLNYRVEFKAIDATNELPLMEAAFITGTSPRVLPVKRIGSQFFLPNHTIIQMLMKSVDEMVERYIEALSSRR